MRAAIILCWLLVIAGEARSETCPEAVSASDKSTCFDTARECASIDSGSVRLACFDKIYGSGHVTANADDNDAAAPVELIATPRQFADRKPDDTRGDRIEATIVEVKTNAHDIDFLTLSNGHTWRENEDSRVRFSTGRKVRIEEGMFGSFNLTMEGAPRSVKVKRIK